MSLDFGSYTYFDFLKGKGSTPNIQKCVRISIGLKSISDRVYYTKKIDLVNPILHKSSIHLICIISNSVIAQPVDQYQIFYPGCLILLQKFGW